MHGQRIRSLHHSEVALQFSDFFHLPDRHWDRIGRESPRNGFTIRTLPVGKKLVDIEPSGLSCDSFQVLSPLFYELIPVARITTESVAQKSGATREELDHGAICDDFRNPPEVFHINLLGGDETLHISVVRPIYGPHLANNTALMPLDVELCVRLERQGRPCLLSWC